MELHIKSEFDCVFMINGELFERAECLTVPEYDVVYITVLPLKLTLLPYTVKLCGSESVESEVYKGLRLDDTHYLLTLSPRYMTVYATAPTAPPAPASPIARLFSLIKNGDLNSALNMLSADLKQTINKSDLNAFFSDYDRIAECTWEEGTKFYLIGKSGAKLHTYTMKDEFIDDITECD